MNTEEHYHPVNGITLHTMEAGGTGGDCILFLHGFPEGWFAWKKQLSFFAQKGFRVIVPDQRGYNLSSKPTGVRAYSLSYLVDDIVTLIRQLGHTKVVLVGHDWGGVVAWHLALHHPELVSHLIIFNMPHPAVFRQTLKTRVSQMLRSSYVAFFQLPLIPERLSRAFDFAVLARSMRKTANEGTFSSQDMEIYKKAWRHPGALTAMLNWYRAYKYNRLSTSGMLAMPVLLIWGAKDQFLIPQMAQPSVERCTSGKLVMMDDATHWIHHEHPVRVNTLIYEFVTKQNTNS